MGDIKTPRNAKGPRNLKVLRKTSASVYASKMPARSARNMKHSHMLKGARHINRIDRQPWEERVAEILKVLEEHRYGRSNALHNAINEAEQAKQLAMHKMAEVETYAEEVQAANEEMRASNEEMQVITEEMERTSMDLERFVPTAEKLILQPLEKRTQMAEELLKTYRDNLPAPVLDELARMITESARMHKMLSGVLDYWQVNMKAEPFSTVDCGLLFETTLLSLDELVVKTGAKISSDPMPRVRADEQQLGSLFEILIHNAIVHGGGDSPNLHVGVQNIARDAVSIPGPEISRGWLFSFRDRGAGVDQELTEQLFHFFPKQEHPQEDFIGMGLAIAWKIVRRHGGRIWCEPNPGGGSVFSFTLPEHELE